MDVLMFHRGGLRRWGGLVVLAGLALLASRAPGVGAEKSAKWQPPSVSQPIRDPQHEINRVVTPWKDLKTRNVVMQQRDYSCGAAALATLLRYYWGESIEEIDVLLEIEAMLTTEELRDRVENGLSIADLRRTAVKLGFQSAIGTMSMEKLPESKVPVIVALEQNEYNHFVVVRGFSGPYVFLADPIRGNVRIKQSEFAEQWIKNTLLVAIRPGQTTSSVSQLGIYRDEVDITALPRQTVRTRIEKVLSLW